jgi:hypothetical protein
MDRYTPPVRPLVEPMLYQEPIKEMPPMLQFESYLAEDTNYFMMGFMSAILLMALFK